MDYIFGNNLEEKNKIMFNDVKDPISARSINRPTRELFETGIIYTDIFQHLSRVLLQNKKNGYLDLYEGFSADKFKVVGVEAKKYLRVPFGAIWTGDEKAPIVINKPNVELFERQIAKCFYFDLNEKYNNVLIDFFFDNDNIIKYNLTISKTVYNSTTKKLEKAEKIYELLSDQYDIYTTINAADSESFIGTYYNNFIMEDYNLEQYIDITDIQDGIYSLCYNTTDKSYSLVAENEQSELVKLLTLTIDNGIVTESDIEKIDYNALNLKKLCVLENNVESQWITTDNIDELIIGETT